MEKEEVSKEEKRRLKKEQKEKVKMEKCPMDRVLMSRYLRSKQRTKERCRESMFVLPEVPHLQKAQTEGVCRAPRSGVCRNDGGTEKGVDAATKG